MDNPKINKEYLSILHERTKYFEGKNINDLTNDEIEEYLKLRKEIVETFPFIQKLSDAIKQYKKSR